jgi:hypothetical protein
MVLEASAIAYVETNLPDDDFYYMPHRLISAAIKATGTIGAVDLITLTAELAQRKQLEDIGGAAYLRALIEACPSAANVAAYAKIVRETAQRRKRLHLSALLLEAERAGDTDKTSRILAELIDIDAERHAEKSRFQFIPHTQAKEFETPEDIIDGALPLNRVVLVYGIFGGYKSTVIAGMCDAVANGVEWYGRKTMQKPVAYICGEDATGFVLRGEALEIYNQREFPYFLLDHAPNLLQIEDVSALIAQLKRLPEMPGLIVFDTLARCMVGGDENSQRDMGVLIHNAELIRRATGATVLIVHHTNQSGGLRGSTSLPGGVDTIIRVEPKDDVAKVHCERQKNGEQFKSFALKKVVIELPRVNRNGDRITSIVLEQTYDTPAERDVVEAISKAQRTRNDILKVLFNFPSGTSSAKWEESCAHLAKHRSFVDHRNALEAEEKAYRVGNIWHAGQPPEELDFEESAKSAKSAKTEENAQIAHRTIESAKSAKNAHSLKESAFSAQNAHSANIGAEDV